MDELGERGSRSTTTTSIPGAVSILAQRDSFVKQVDQHVDVAIHASLLQNLQLLRRLQSLEKRAELGIGECKGPLLGYFMLVVMFLTLLC